MDPNDFYSQLPQRTLEYLFNPTAKNIGDTLGGISELLLSPVNIGTTWANAHIRKFKQSIIDNVNKIPEENRDPSKLNLAIKTIEDSKYQISDDNLRQMFATLISSSLDKTRNQYLSPRFSTVLSQFSPEDAKFLKEIAVDSSDKPAYRFRIDLGPGKGEATLNDHHIATNFDKGDDYVAINYACNELALDNLVASNIINVKNGEWQIKDNEFFDYLLNSSDFISTKKAIEKEYLKLHNNKNFTVDIEKDCIKFTTFGKRFIDAIIT